MKMIVIAFALVALAVAAPPDVSIVRSDIDLKPDGAYHFAVETSDGSKRDEVGELKQALDEDNKPREVVVVRGSFSYVGPEGNIETVSYEADENGYRAVGPSIPKSR